MKNLLKETEVVLKKHGKTWDDVQWVGGDDFAIPVNNFIEVARKTDYDNWYGSPRVAIDLHIVGDGWYMERQEYDGAEYWEFRQPPVMPAAARTVNKLAVKTGGRDTLEEVQTHDDSLYEL